MRLKFSTFNSTFKSMGVNVVDDIKPVSELKAKTREIIQQAKDTGRPVVITVNGRPSVVLIDAEEYERQRQALHLATLLAQGESDIREGRTRPMKAFLKDLARGKKIRR
jgi:prevent-host-death family protein